MEKKKMLLFLLTISLFVSAFPIWCYADTLPGSFVSAVEELEKYASQKGIQIDSDEDIKDAVTLGYLNAVNRLGVSFGALDHKILLETIQYMAIWCWFPIIPPEKKKEESENLKRIRKALANNIYERTLVSLSVLPGLAVTSVGEILPPNQLIKFYSPSFLGSQLYQDFASRKIVSQDITSKINDGKIKYRDILYPDWTNKYLKWRQK